MATKLDKKDVEYFQKQILCIPTVKQYQDDNAKIV